MWRCRWRGWLASVTEWWGRRWPMPVGLLVAVVTVAILVGFGLLIRLRLRVVKEARQLWPRLEAEAAALGYRPAPDEAGPVAEALRAGPRFRDSRLELPNLLSRQAGGNRRYLTEYRSTTGTSDPSIEKGWLFAVRLDDRRLPRFLLFHPPVKLPKLIVAGPREAGEGALPRLRAGRAGCRVPCPGQRTDVRRKPRRGPARPHRRRGRDARPQRRLGPRVHRRLADRRQADAREGAQGRPVGR